MQVRPQDRVYVAVLAVAIVAVLVYLVAFGIPRMMESRRTASAQGPPAPQPVRTSASLSLPEETLDPLQRQALAQLDPDYPGPPATGRDPFRPPPGVPVPNRPSSSVAPPQPDRPRPIRDRSRVNPRDLVPTGPPLRPVEIAPIPAPSFEVKGVIPGDPSLAIVSVDGQTSYKRVGEALAQGWVISRISEMGVLLRNGRRSLTIEVGHAAQPDPQTGSAPATKPVEPRPSAFVPPAAPRPSAPTQAGQGAGRSRADVTKLAAKKAEPAPRRNIRSNRRRGRIAAAPRYVFTGRRL